MREGKEEGMFTRKLAKVLGISLVTTSMVLAGGTYGQNDGTMDDGGTDIEIETTQPGARQNLQQGIIGFGPATFRSVNSGDAYNVNGGYMIQLNPFAALKGVADATTDFDETVLASIGVGGNLYPFNRDFSPYIGADVGVGYLQEPDRDSWAFNLGTSIGAEVFRTAPTQMQLEIGARFHLEDFDDEDPLLYTARVGVLF